MRAVDEVGPDRQDPPARPGRDQRPGTAGLLASASFRDRPGGLIAKIVLLGLTGGIAVWAAFPLIADRAWPGLGILAAPTLGIFYLYLPRRHVPAKYLVPGTLFLIAFQLYPVL